MASVELPEAPAPAPARPDANGNEALALGALSGGLRFLSFYPMTPSTSIALTVVEHAAALGVVTEQAEDEIAAVNMAIGASFAGAPAMVTTSGGGFAPMVEGASRRATTETPPWRCWPSGRPGDRPADAHRTGGPGVRAGRGARGACRAIFAPGKSRGVFQTARKVFFLAELSRGRSSS